MRNVVFTCEHESDASADGLWKHLSSWEEITEFWKGTREIQKLDNDTFQVRFAFPGTARMELLLDEAGKTVTEKYLSGPFKGTKKTSIVNDNGKAKMKTEWDVNLSLMLSLAGSRLQKHFTEGTQNALRRISDAAESSTA